ncbi:MAG: hypothetical protein JKY33_10465 [Bacteroidia bacterium]|nr:hypothetical protein [Bacteroidia bacterium]
MMLKSILRFLLLLFAFTIASNFAFSQSHKQSKKTKKISAKQRVTNELIQSMNLMYIGIACTGAGTALTTIGTMQPVTSSVYKPMMYTGLGLSLIGVVIMIEGHSHVRNATSIMKLKITGNSIGLLFSI